MPNKFTREALRASSDKMNLRDSNVKHNIGGMGRDKGQALVGGERRTDMALPQDSSHMVQKQYPCFSITKGYVLQFIIYCKPYKHL